MNVLSYDPETILVPSGENATDEITWLWAFVFSLSSSSLSARQANRRQSWPRRGDFEGSGAPKSQTLIVLSYDPDTILVPSGENATEQILPLWAFVFSLRMSPARSAGGGASERRGAQRRGARARPPRRSGGLPARQGSRSQFWPRRGDFEGSGAPESQTLIVLSSDPDTILVPSGENATE